MEEWKAWWKSTGNPLVNPHIEGGSTSMMSYEDATGTAERARASTIEIILENLESITSKLTKLQTEVLILLPAKMDAVSQQAAGGAAGGKKRRSSKRRRRKTRRY